MISMHWFYLCVNLCEKPHNHMKCSHHCTIYLMHYINFTVDVFYFYFFSSVVKADKTKSHIMFTYVCIGLMTAAPTHAPFNWPISKKQNNKDTKKEFIIGVTAMRMPFVVVVVAFHRTTIVMYFNSYAIYQFNERTSALVWYRSPARSIFDAAQF